MEFEWDAKKAKANLRKHDVSFLEASTALRDPLSTTGRDPDHSDDEERFVTFGMSSRGRLLVSPHGRNNSHHQRASRNKKRTEDL
jgi:hypothetical protein